MESDDAKATPHYGSDAAAPQEAGPGENYLIGSGQWWLIWRLFP